MSFRDFGVVLFICVVWALNSIVGKIVVGPLALPPLFFAAARFLLVVAVTIPWLLPVPRQFGLVTITALLMGAGSFGLVSVGLQTASPSMLAIMLLCGTPLTAILSVLFLGERITATRGVGITLTFGAVILVMWNPDGYTMSIGVIFIGLAVVAGALGTVLIKRVRGVGPMQFQAWVGLTSAILLGLASLGFETGQVQHATDHFWPFLAAVAFSALVVSVLSHSLYFGLVQRYEASLVAPLTLLSPIMTIALGVLLTGDHFDTHMAIGAALALIGVLMIVLRRAQWLAIARLRRPEA